MAGTKIPVFMFILPIESTPYMGIIVRVHFGETSCSELTGATRYIPFMRFFLPVTRFIPQRHGIVHGVCSVIFVIVSVCIYQPLYRSTIVSTTVSINHWVSHCANQSLHQQAIVTNQQSIVPVNQPLGQINQPLCQTNQPLCQSISHAVKRPCCPSTIVSINQPLRQPAILSINHWVNQPAVVSTSHCVNQPLCQINRCDQSAPVEGPELVLGDATPAAVGSDTNKHQNTKNLDGNTMPATLESKLGSKKNNNKTHVDPLARRTESRTRTHAQGCQWTGPTPSRTAAPPRRKTPISAAPCGCTPRAPSPSARPTCERRRRLTQTPSATSPLKRLVGSAISLMRLVGWTIRLTWLVGWTISLTWLVGLTISWF